MGKTIAVASKFTEEELNRIDFFVQQRNTTRSTLVHDLVMDAVDGRDSREDILGNSDIKKVRFLFKDNFAYFWKDREYEGIINADANCANLYFGGEWKTYSLDELPVVILEWGEIYDCS